MNHPVTVETVTARIEQLQRALRNVGVSLNEARELAFLDTLLNYLLAEHNQ